MIKYIYLWCMILFLKHPGDTSFHITQAAKKHMYIIIHYSMQGMNSPLYHLPISWMFLFCVTHSWCLSKQQVKWYSKYLIPSNLRPPHSNKSSISLYFHTTGNRFPKDTHTHTHTHILSYTHTHTLCLSLSLSLTQCLTHTHTHTAPLSLRQTLSLSLSLSHTHTHTHTHTQTQLQKQVLFAVPWRCHLEGIHVQLKFYPCTGVCHYQLQLIRFEIAAIGNNAARETLLDIFSSYRMKVLFMCHQ